VNHVKPEMYQGQFSIENQKKKMCIAYVVMLEEKKKYVSLLD